MEPAIHSETLKQLFSKSTDVLVRPLVIKGQAHLKVHLFCVDGLINSQILDTAILRPLATDAESKKCTTEEELSSYLLQNCGAYHAFAKEETSYDKMITFVMSGMVALIFDGLEKAVIFDVRTFDKRSIQEPSEESTMKGSKDSFIEVLRTNSALIRRRIRSPYLVVEQMYVGRLSKTDVALVYLSNLCDIKLVNYLRQKIKDIEIDNISAASFVEEFIRSNPGSLLPQVMYTQRPDRCCSNLTDGRIALIIDGIPYVYLFPCQLVMLMQSPEDYSEHFIVSSALRTLRYFCMVLSLLLPAFYICITAFHNQLLPAQMLLSIQEAKQNVPFSSPLEVLGLLFAFELLIEAGLRLPKTVGQAMSVVGGLVVGQAAVSANLLSPVVVIVIALTGVSGFAVPNQDLAVAIRISRFALALLASFSGMLGFLFGIIFIITHLCGLESFGIAFLSPFVDAKSSYLQDTFFRFPVKYFKFRPDNLALHNHRKQK